MAINEPPVRRQQGSPDTSSNQLNKVKKWLKETPKQVVAGVVLLVIGFLGTIVGLGIFLPIFWLGLGLLIAQAFMRLPRMLGKDQVVSRYGTIIEGGKGIGEELLKDTEQLIIETEAPDIRVERQTITAGILGVLGGKRSCLVISNAANPHLKPYKMYLNARDYGIHLQVSWYVANQPDVIQKTINLLTMVPIIGLILLPLRSAIAKQGGSLGLDIFDEQDLEAYISNAHHCLLRAVDNLGKDRGIDTSKINRQPKGFLGIS